MRAFLAIALTLGLCGCSDWNGSFFGYDDTHEAQAAPAPVAEPAPAPVMSTAAPSQMTQAQPAETSEPQPPASIQPRGSIGAHCTILAKQRAADAAYAGEDEETQQSVYDRTYAGCMDWDAKHAS
jgi:hypothetical protein